MDVFHVTGRDGNKITDERVIEYIQQSLGTNACLLPSFRRTVGVKAASEHTTIELTGTDRLGLLSEVFVVLTDLKCNVVGAEVWTHNTRVASLVYVTEECTGAPIDDPDRLSKIKVQLCNVLKGDNDKRGAKTVASMGVTHTEGRLQQMMFADCDYERVHNGLLESRDNKVRPLLSMQNCVEKGFYVINIKSKDRPKLVFDTVCTLTYMQYVVFHGTVDLDRPDAFQEYYIRHMDGCPENSEVGRQRIIHCLEAAIERRVSEGLRLELCTGDRVGLLSGMTRIFCENGLSVTRAEVSTRGDKAVNVFYVTDAAGNLIHGKTVEAVRSEIGQTILQVKKINSKSPSEEIGGMFSLGNIFRSTSERFLYNLGLIKTPLLRGNRQQGQGDPLAFIKSPTFKEII